ncbi:MAG: hypothetical protein F6J95_019050 [Leptolyngbya sp. SIO1E4]|nr:hypothetical protein [Leptolyngbya sp. SIO1E4]
MNKVFVSVLLVLLMAIGSGCSRLSSSWRNFVDPEIGVDFLVNDVNIAGQSGNISLQGTASLPDGTQLAVSAVRILEEAATNEAADSLAYAILDRQSAVVENAQWQATLALQQVDANGAAFENWQSNPNLMQETLSPSPQVLLMVTLEPTHFSADIEDVLTNAVINGGDSQLSFTANGEPYLQISQSVAIQIPPGTVAQGDDFTLAQTDDIWQERSSYNPRVDQVNETPELPFTEADNLPLPASNMLQ